MSQPIFSHDELVSVAKIVGIDEKAAREHFDSIFSTLKG